MNSNIYWPVYRSIESEIENLMFHIHVDDAHLNVYSAKISDLVMRCAVEIESISKELYKVNGGPQKEKLNYDEDALKFLNSKWKLDEKSVIISSGNCFLTKRELKPFQKTENRTNSNRPTYTWNNAYQNLKHDRVSSLKFGSVKYLFDIAAALYVLNLYFKEITFPLGSDSSAKTFDLSLGSSIFSVKLHRNFIIDFEKRYIKNIDFDECIYLLTFDDRSFEDLSKAFKLHMRITESEPQYDVLKELNKKYPNSDSFIDDVVIAQIDRLAQNGLWGKLNKGPISQIDVQFLKMKFEARINKGEF
ncbi:hypothetical protein M3O96_03070 [Aquiflexum sp. TKW24L]|uniref:hypothetical protein n=1 Tax=Aquiflexum sp. TKW24L TaxID=2942212 RepID=UPI0020BFDF08|nr:hypothetical protein [Aquiflexum sp. TKW24L]MCL6258052.1 hypothetical protein [Aquiflexum sp. TKW24L]